MKKHVCPGCEEIIEGEIRDGEIYLEAMEIDPAEIELTAKEDWFRNLAPMLLSLAEENNVTVGKNKLREFIATALVEIDLGVQDALITKREVPQLAAVRDLKAE